MDIRELEYFQMVAKMKSFTGAANKLCISQPSITVASKSHIPPEKARAYNALYTNTEEETKNPYVSPVFATPKVLSGLPDALVLTGGLDMLHNEAEKYAFMLMEAGVKVTIKKYENSSHGFTIYCSGNEWPQAHKLIVETINQL